MVTFNGETNLTSRYALDPVEDRSFALVGGVDPVDLDDPVPGAKSGSLRGASGKDASDRPALAETCRIK